MSPIEPIAPAAVGQISALFPTDEVGPLAARGTQAAGNFGEMFSQGISRLNEQLLSNQADLQQVATGEAQNLHQIMIRLEESRVSFQLMMQVRGRLLEAYQDIMKMQV